MIRMSRNTPSGPATPRFAEPLTEMIAAIEHVLDEASQLLYRAAIVKDVEQPYVDATSPAWLMHQGLDAWSATLRDNVRRCWTKFAYQVIPNGDAPYRLRGLSEFVADELWEACCLWEGAMKFLGRDVTSADFWREVRIEWNNYLEVLYMECIHVDINDGTPLEGRWDPCVHFYWNWHTQLSRPKSRNKPARHAAAPADADAAVRLV